MGCVVDDYKMILLCQALANLLLWISGGPNECSHVLNTGL